MRVLIDTNVLLSALLNEKSRVAQVVMYINQNSKYEVLLTDQNIQELHDVIKRKIPKLLPKITDFFEGLHYEALTTPCERATLPIRDPKDQPILDAAVTNDVDVILTGDKDFLALKLKHPRCMTVAEFCAKEGLKF